MAHNPPAPAANTGGWNAPGATNGGGGTTFDTTTAPTGQATYGWSTDEANIPVFISRSGPRTDATKNFMGPVGPDQLQPLDMPVWQVMSNFESLPTDKLISQQKQLFAAGYYDKYLKSGEIPKFGQMDQDTMNAFGDAVRETVRRNGSAVGNGGNRSMTIDDVISQGAATRQATGTGNAKPPKLTNPQDVEASAQAEAMQTLGQRLTPDQLAAIDSNYENMAQTTYAQSQQSGTYYSKPTASGAWLDEQLRSMLPQTAQAYQTSQNIGQFLKLVDQDGLFSAYHQ